MTASASLQKRDTAALRPVEAEPLGVLSPAEAARAFRLARYRPSDDLAAFVEHHWIVAWQLPEGRTHRQRTLPSPCVNLVFEAGQTAIFGVVRGVFEVELGGTSRALGVRFRPAGFRAILKRPVASITGKQLPIAAVFADGRRAEAAVLGADDDAGMVAAAEAMLRAVVPAPDPVASQVNEVVDRIGNDLGIVRVERAAALAGLSSRTLQRLFVEYVGVTPKWVIRRARLHQANAALGRGDKLDVTRLAQELGYYDQAHFSRDFRATVGIAPSEYQRANAKAR